MFFTRVAFYQMNCNMCMYTLPQVEKQRSKTKYTISYQSGKPKPQKIQINVFNAQFTKYQRQ